MCAKIMREHLQYAAITNFKQGAQKHLHFARGDGGNNEQMSGCLVLLNSQDSV